MLKIILIDDEVKALQSLEYELLELKEPMEILGKFNDADEAIDFINDHAVDCVFLDIEMPKMNGFRLLERLSNRNFHVIITTAYEQYAIEALKENALDYLLKPVDSDDLKETMVRIRESQRLRERQKAFEEALESLNRSGFNQERKIGISIDGKIIFLLPEEIIYCESDGNYCSIHLKGNKRLFVSRKLKDIERLLPPQYFYRIHHSYVVNIEKVREYLKTDGYVILDENNKIPVSRQRRSLFLERI